jgi:AcrR family transcriptional regulator
MEQTLSRRERKKLETRQSLLEAAWALFHDKGFDDTTVEEITERADVAKGTFFNYFSSKDALLGEWALWRFSQLHDALDVGQGAPESPVARIELLLRFLHEQMLGDWQLFQQAFATRLGKPPPSQHQTKRRLTGLLTELVKEAQACGEIRADVEAEVVSDLVLVTHIRRLAICIHKLGVPPPAEDSDQVIDLLMDGLAGPGWTRPGRTASEDPVMVRDRRRTSSLAGCHPPERQ